MADAASHLRQARENREHAEWLLATRPSDETALRWAVTAAFYCAVHAMTAYLLDCGVTVENHDERRWALADPRNGVPRDVYRAYGRLQGRSVGARYMLQVFTPAQVRQLLDRELAAVTSFVGL